MGLTWMGTQLWMTPDPLTKFVETTAPCEAARVAVDAVLPELRKDLGLDKIAVRWFRPESSARKAFRESTGSTAWHTFEAEEGRLGQCLGSAPEEVWIRSDLPAIDAAEVLAHELWHSADVKRFVDGTAEMPDGELGEQAALNYGRAVRQALVAD